MYVRVGKISRAFLANGSEYWLPFPVIFIMALYVNNDQIISKYV